VAGCLGVLGGEDGDGGEDGPVAASTFDDGAEGWTAVDLVDRASEPDPDWRDPLATLSIEHVATGGVEDSGYVERTDTTGSAFFFEAPSAFLGDRSAVARGRLTFQLRSTDANYRKDSAVVLVGADSVVATEFDAPETDWTGYEVALDAGAREFRAGSLGGSTVDQERVRSVLGDLRALRISGEHGAQVEETVGLDEVALHAP
jgi:hypothetical protein